jgi:CRISPR system Cascade subunit CasA
MPAIQRAEIKSYGVVNAEISTGNTTIFSSSQIERNLSDSEKAILVPQLMGCALGGKKTDNSIVLSEGYLGKSNDKGKPSAGKPGPSVGFMGFLHSFLQGNTLIESIWLNLFTEETIRHLNMFPEGVGTPPWEAMPETENCAVASQLQHSYMGRLLPVSRFLLLKNDGLHYSEGVAYPSFKDGVFDPSITVNMQGKDPKAIWTDPERRPWRYLTSLLSFLTENTPNNFECWQLKQGMQRARTATASIGIWCGGLRVSSNAGEQYASGQDDYVESAFKISCDHLGQQWFDTFNHEMARLEEVAKTVYGATSKYFAEQKVEGAKYASLASGLFWQLSEERAQDLIDACATPDASKSLRQSFANIALQAFDATCPQGTSRQIDIWAKTRPNLRKYLEL